MSMTIKLLQDNGFECVRQYGSHMIFENKKTNRRIAVPYYSKELKRGCLKMQGFSALYCS